MQFSYQLMVLAALAFETAFAQPAHRHAHPHHSRSLSDVLGKRDGVDWDSPSTYKNPVTGQPFTKAEWNCFVAKKGDASCNTIDTGAGAGAPPASSSPAPAAATAAAKPEEKMAEPQSKSPSSPAPSQSASSGSDSDSGPGAHIFNKGSKTQTFAFYKNNPGDDSGQASNPDDDKTITLTPGSDKFVPLPTSWKGHVQRGQSNLRVISPASWAEIQVQATDGQAWGDISLQKGCDGAVKIISPTNGKAFGFDIDIISNAPEAAKVKTYDGQDALGYTTGGWMGPILETPNQAAIEWEQGQVGQTQVYILGGSGTDVVQSSTNVLHVEFY